MIDNGYLLRYLNYVCNKTQGGNTFSIPEFTDVLGVCSVKLAKLRIGLEVLPANHPLKQEFEKNAGSTNSLSHLKVWMGSPQISPLTINSDGIATIPKDYLYHSACTYKQLQNVNCETKIKNRVVEVLNDTAWDSVSESTIRPASYKYPIMNYQDGFIRFMPKDLRFVDYIYLKKPVTPKYDFYIDSYGEQVYLPQGTKHELLVGEEGSNGQLAPATVTSQSVESGWNDSDLIDLATLMLWHIGINLQRNDLVQISEILKKEGV